MATIKINYNGTIYSMVKTSSKITSPSVAVDGGWIPCFKGDRFAEVTHGDRIYTLSPLMVNGYRMACGSREAFNGTIYVNISYSLRFQGGGSNTLWILEVHQVQRAYTNIPGYSCLLTNVIWNQKSLTRSGSYSNGCPSGMDIDQSLVAAYSILNNGNVVKSGIISKRIFINNTGKTAGNYTDGIAV